MIHTHISLVRDENPANGIGSLGHLRVRKKETKKERHKEGVLALGRILAKKKADR
jgi:hypothetical protein